MNLTKRTYPTWVALALVIGVGAGLGACSRSLSDRERLVADAVLGEGLDADRVRVTHRLGALPLPRARSVATRNFPTERVNCLPPPKKTRGAAGPPVAYVGFHTIHYTKGNYRADTLATWSDKAVPLAELLTLAHELVHVWQWQNREITGYHPIRAFSESVVTVDPYAYGLGRERTFLEYGYEQQARMVENYLCLSVVDPTHPHRAELAALMKGHFPLERIDALLARGPGGLASD